MYVVHSRMLWLIVAVAASPAFAQEATEVEDANADAVPTTLHPLITYRTFLNPRLPAPLPTRGMSERIQQLWLKTLDSDETDLVREAVLAIGETHRGGYLDFSPAADRLQKLLAEFDSNLTLLRDIVRTLDIIDARGSAPELQAVLDKHPSLASTIEPALARWKFQPMQARWLKRVEAPAAKSRHLTILAIQGIGQAEVAEAASPLMKIVTDGEQSFRVRHEAARALSVIGDEGITATAETLQKRSSIPARILAAELLQKQDSEQAKALLVTLAGDTNAAVAEGAWRRLRQINSESLVPLIAVARASSDAKVRTHAVAVMIAHPDDERIAWLAEAMGDGNPTVRNAARTGLLQLAESGSLTDSVISVATDTLIQPKWQGIEQATLLLTQLKHTEARIRIGELLRHKRREVHTAAAWSLKEFNSRDMLPLMLQRATEIDAVVPNRPNYYLQALDMELAHLFEAFQAMNYRNAEPLMRRYVPKGLGERFDMIRARCAAIWTMGFYYEDNADRSLAREMSARMLDNGLPPEHVEVKAICAVSLGRMKAVDHLQQLRDAQIEFGVDTLAGVRTAWALNRITGEPLPQLVPRVKSRGNWFLEPLPKSR